MATKVGSLKVLLVATSIFEGATGLALMSTPTLVVKLLLESPLTDPMGVLVARICGSALLSIALACWFSRKNESVNGLIIALLFYNLASVLLLGYAGLYEKLTGIALWPAVGLHVLMALWSAKCLNIKSLK